jgi:hypothetical protein
MIRARSERGISIEPFLGQYEDPHRCQLNPEEIVLIDFATLPSEHFVRVANYPVEATFVIIEKKGDKLRIEIRTVWPSQEGHHTASEPVILAGLLEAAESLRLECGNLRVHRKWSCIVMWTSRYQRGDAVLRFVDERYRLIVERAHTLLQDAIEDLRWHPLPILNANLENG